MKSRMLRHQSHKHPLSKIPPERMKALNAILYDRETITVYSDCSCLKDHPYIGVAACYVADQQTIVESKKLYLENTDISMYAEIKAVTFAIECLPKLVEKYRRLLTKPDKIVIYSDCNHVESLLAKGPDIKNPIMREATLEATQMMELFREQNSEYSISVRYIGDEKKHNMFHFAAHNAARRLLPKVK